MKTATIFNIESGSYVDGPGIRTTVFFKGCNLSCKWCHNPESQHSAPQMLFYKERCNGCGSCKSLCKNGLEHCDLCGRCTRFCPQDARKICGKPYTVEDVFSEIKKDEDYYKTSGGGVTFSGGECMLFVDFLAEILQKCKENGISTAVDTAGCVPFESFERVLAYTDLFLYDIKAMSPHLHKEQTGRDNALILQNLSILLGSCPEKIMVRIPLMKGVNDTDEEIGQIIAFFNKYGKPKEIRLLPFHRLGKAKYEATGKTYEEFYPPEQSRLREIVEKLEKAGLYAYVGV